jgi:hypothetical protein
VLNPKAQACVDDVRHVRGFPRQEHNRNAIGREAFQGPADGPVSLGLGMTEDQVRLFDQHDQVQPGARCRPLRQAHRQMRDQLTYGPGIGDRGRDQRDSLQDPDKAGAILAHMTELTGAGT